MNESCEWKCEWKLWMKVVNESVNESCKWKCEWKLRMKCEWKCESDFKWLNLVSSSKRFYTTSRETSLKLNVPKALIEPFDGRINIEKSHFCQLWLFSALFKTFIMETLESSEKFLILPQGQHLRIIFLKKMRV